MLGPNLLAVHVNLLAQGDAALLGRRRVNVIHCPRSHDYFRHPPFPRERLAKAGVNLCLPHRFWVFAAASASWASPRDGEFG